MIAGVVLAAGRSSRMGRPKALLEFGGRTFLERILVALRDGGCDPLLVVTGPETLPGAAEIEARAVAEAARTVTNPDPASEQIESLRIAIRALPPELEGVMMTPVDSPGIAPGTVAALIAAAREGAPVVVPTVEGRRGHPILFAGPALEELLEPLAEGARTVLQRHREDLVEVPVESTDILLDVDTPEEYERLREGRP